MAGWVPMDADSWPFIAASLAFPWPREACLFDLRWHADRITMGGRARMPGRPTLRKRWGWTDKPVRRLLASDDWADPSIDGGPARVQPRSTGA